MKILLFLCVALLGSLTVKAQDVEFPDPITFELGDRIDGDGLVNLYYGESVETATPSEHSVTINWEDAKVNHIRLYAYADNAVYESSGLPGDSGTITVTSQNVNHLEVVAYMYGVQ